MEIISYVVEGELSHADSMGNEQTLHRGQVQYMSAGTGITHSEFNHGNVPLRFFQIWIFADKTGHTPTYGDHRFAWEDRTNRWMPIATYVENPTSYAPVKIHQDVNVYATEITAGNSLSFVGRPGRQSYLVVAEGKARINGIGVRDRDAMEIIEEDIEIVAIEDTHIVLVEMAQG
jgi:redox-sensitive bicupin YhaK (pirin superfamily)